jgi:predicted nucleic acid-binding protein
MILKLGEAQVIRSSISTQVLREVENALRRKAPQSLGDLVLILDRSNLIVATQPSRELIEKCQELVNHPGDALVLAAAWGVEIDFFVTLDRKHFLDNQSMKTVIPFLIGTPGDFIDWLRNTLFVSSPDL